MPKLTYRFEVFKGADSAWRWRLVASNGRRVATSGESFASKSNAKRAARAVAGKAAAATFAIQK